MLLQSLFVELMGSLEFVHSLEDDTPAEVTETSILTCGRVFEIALKSKCMILHAA